MELLAPAGSLESLNAAVYAGADAVYLGGKMFNARQNAMNFSITEIKTAVELAHDYGVRIYVTVNTLTHEHELVPMGEYLCSLANCHIDAFIVQDLGVAQLAQEVAPDIEVHASTQMTIHATAALPFLIENNIKRVVLAREVPIQTVSEMQRKYPQIGVEVFSHGALCYAYSGQCLMSSIIGGRSGNRGSCAGPCRLPYTLVKNGKSISTAGKYLMSPKDLCLIEELSRLKKQGVSAIKIEGRSKRPEYVFAVVDTYRRALDSGDRFKLVSVEKLALEQAFNRGFTRGLILGEKGSKLMGIDRPDNRGVIVAEVAGCYPGGVKARAITNLYKGDIVGWRADDQTKTITLSESYAKGATIRLSVGSKVTPGSKIYRVVSIEQQRLVSEALRRPLQKFALELSAKLIVGEVIEITGRDSEGYQVTVRGEHPLKKAHSRAATAEFVCQKLSKLGGTSWYLSDCKVHTENAPAVSVAELNNCRRKLISKLAAKKRQATNKSFSVETCQTLIRQGLDYQVQPITDLNITPRLAVTVTSFQEAKAALGSKADLIYVGSAEWSDIPLAEMEQIQRLAKDKLVWRWPRISQDQEIKLLRDKFNQMREIGIKKVMLDNYGQLGLARYLPDMEYSTGSGIHIFNCLTIQKLKENNIARVTLSPELTYTQMRSIAMGSVMPLEIIVHGRLLLMIHESCILKNIGLCKNNCREQNWGLKDRKNYTFPLKFDKRHRSYLYNSQDLALYDKIKELLQLKPAVLRIEGAGRGESYISKVTAVYKEILNSALHGEKVNKKEAAKIIFALCNTGVTRGHWQRGV